MALATIPFDLKIENQYKGQATPVFYIVSFPRVGDFSQKVRFEFINRANKEIVLNNLNTADKNNFHFALVFRPGTLHYENKEEVKRKLNGATISNVNTKKLSDEWFISELITQDDATEIIYFSAKQLIKIGSNQKISFLVDNLSAAKATGTRSTQVQLLYKEAITQTESIIHTRNQHLDIVNHDGKSYAPLDFVILGDSTIIPRSKNNTVNLQMVVTDNTDLVVAENTTIELKIPYFKDEYQADIHPAWVFGKQDDVKNIECNKGKDESTEITFALGSEIPYTNWGYLIKIIKFSNKEKINNLLFNLLNVPADGPIGGALIKITVNNLPGYWDSDFEIRLQKTFLSSIDDLGYNPGYAMINNQLLVGKHLPQGWQIDKALNSSLSITSTNIAGNENKNVNSLLRLHDGSFTAQNSMNGMEISVGNWQELQNVNQPPKIDAPNLKNGYLIKADQYNQGTRFKVDFFGNVEADGKVIAQNNIETKKHIKAEGRIKDKTGFITPVGTIVGFYGHKAPEGWLLCNGKQYKASNYPDLYNIIDSNKSPIEDTSKLKIEKEKLIQQKNKLDDHQKTLITELEKIEKNLDIYKSYPLWRTQFLNQQRQNIGLTKNNQENIKAISEKIENLNQRINDSNSDSNSFKTPDLRSRFIVGAGKADGLRDYPLGIGTNSGAETHTLTVNEMPKHSHGQERARWNTMQWKGGDRDPFWTDDEKNKWESVNTHNTGGNQAHNNLPPYYALTYIIKC